MARAGSTPSYPRPGASRTKSPTTALVATLVLVCGCRTPSAPPLPDLVVSTVSVPSTAVGAAQTWSIGATVVNGGSAAVAASGLAYWYSVDGVFDAGDVFIGTSPIPVLDPGASYVDTWSDSYAVVDSGGGAGTHRIFVVADPDAAISEADEGNNLAGGEVAVLYERIVIDTYRPKAGVVTANSFLSLFGPAGDPTRETGLEMWNNDDIPFTADAPPVSLAEDDDGNPAFFGCARIDYTGGLAPGTYYVRVRGQKSTSTGVYAVRLLRPAIGEIIGDSIAEYTAWTFPATGDDAAYEPDDAPPSGGVPVNPIPIAIGESLNRRLMTTSEPDVDWLVFTLP